MQLPVSSDEAFLGNIFRFHAVTPYQVGDAEDGLLIMPYNRLPGSSVTIPSPVQIEFAGRWAGLGSPCNHHHLTIHRPVAKCSISATTLRTSLS